MGDEVEPRRRFIEDNADQVRYEDLEFDVGLSPDYFSLRQLRARN